MRKFIEWFREDKTKLREICREILSFILKTMVFVPLLLAFTGMFLVVVAVVVEELVPPWVKTFLVGPLAVLIALTVNFKCLVLIFNFNRIRHFLGGRFLRSFFEPMSF